MNNTLSNVLLIGIALIGLFLIFCVIVSYLVFRQLQRFISPNTAALIAQFDRQSAAKPSLSREAHIRRIIHQQALKCGVVGAVTGLGGFITFPIALPVDLILSMRIQATMVQFIAMAYGQSPANSVGLRLQTQLITSGTVEVTERTFSFTMKIVARLLGESLAILIPAIGAIVGFIVNYGIAQATGQLALRWYAGMATTPAIITQPVRYELKR